MEKIFLGGTCNGSKWREDLIDLLKIDYFNPVVENWTSECQEEEIRQRDLCDFCLYVITPKMIGVYSIAEAVDDSNKRPQKTIFCILERDHYLKFSNYQMNSLKSTAKMISSNGAKVCHFLEDVADYVNEGYDNE